MKYKTFALLVGIPLTLLLIGVAAENYEKGCYKYDCIDLNFADYTFNSW